ncbi:uncharacterized protein RCC_10822 [Ramularia collo-cygni]|uniref:BTB domain-containing protein n=1 Tax=Ramularia collo-cygni TaxID=112498 RepID=A0A2D3VAI8_9PEZI|nr:uncharacterized protein RCC_10822 [Ramularia collo-cygni]CZT25093.1 uncharacterized protein RCC_10822 [Ramularia collo-cygni]
MQLVQEAYMQALKTPTITLVVGDTGHSVPCVLAFLALHSEYFAKVLSKPGALEDGQAQLQLQRVTLSSVETFVHWCYKCQYLDLAVKEGATVEELRNDKDTLIDLWVFTDEHNISCLQNEAMTCLRGLLGTHPFLLTPQDIRFIFSRTPEPNSPLRRLAITILVAQLHTAPSTTKIEDFDDLFFKGAITMIFHSTRNWNLFERKHKELKEKTLLALLGTPQMVKLLSVREEEPALWVLALCGIAPKASASGVRAEPIEVD